MRLTGLILIILGSLMIVFNLLAYAGKAPDGPKDTDTISKVAYYIGFNLFLIVGIIVLIVGYRIRRKAINKKVKKELLDSFLTNKPQN